MNLILKEKTAILAIVGFIFLSSGLFCNHLEFYSRDRIIYSTESNDINFKTPTLKTAKISAKIHINNNWTKAKSVGICNGSGTWSDPYVIKDLIIDGFNSSHCIKVQNSNVYFRIENCTLYNAGTDWSSEYAGILLDHTSNGFILDNNCSQNMYGIFLVSFSSNNTVYRNYANNNFYTGISLNSLCNNNTVFDNSANNNSVFGIGISWNSHNNTISKNNATNNKIGLAISSFSKNNIIKNNNLSYNTFMGESNNGVRISRSENNTLVRNLVSYNGWEGIQAYESNHNFFLNNSIINNGDLGISLVRCDDNRLIANNISFNGQYGVYFEESERNIINFNTLDNHDVGIYLDDQSKCNLVSNNFYFSNGVDIQDFQRTCEGNGLITPPINILLISITIVGIMFLIIVVILALRNLLRIKMKNR